MQKNITKNRRNQQYDEKITENLEILPTCSYSVPINSANKGPFEQNIQKNRDERHFITIRPQFNLDWSTSSPASRSAGHGKMIP